MMKNPFLILLLTICICSLEINAQSTKAVLFLKDGSQISGFAKLKRDNTIKFRKTRDSKPKIYSFKGVGRVEIFDAWEESSTYVQELVIGEEKPLILELLEVGKINLYILTVNYKTSIGSYSGTTINYYIKKEGERAVYPLSSNDIFRKDFTKGASLLFKDCPDIVAKIKSREYKRRDLREMIVFYNNQCD